MLKRLEFLLGLGWARMYAEGPDGGGGAAPVETPPAAPAPEPGGSKEAASELPVDELLAPDDDTGTEAPPQEPPSLVKPPEAPAAAPAPEAVKPPEAAPAAEPAKAPPAAPEKPVAQEPQQPAPPPAPEAPQLSAEQMAEQAAKRRADFKKSLVNLYQPSVAENADKLISEPAEVLSNLAADLHMQVLESAVHGIMAQIPQIVAGHLQAIKAAEENEKAFFSTWPQLAEKRGEAMPLIQRFGNIYRQSNPAASKEDFIREVGSMVMVSLKIPAAAAPAQEPPQAPTPFSPAMPGASGGQPTPPKPKTEWEVLQEDFMKDDAAA